MIQFLIVAVALGALSVVGIKVYVDNIRKESLNQADLMPVLVASRDIASGSEFVPDDLDTVEYPRRVVNNLLPNLITNDKEILGARSAVDIGAGEALQAHHFHLRQRNNLEYPSDHRAITIPISLTEGVGGFLKPLDFVDILGTFDATNNSSADGEGELTFARIIFKKVQILATGDITDRYDLRAGTGQYAHLTFSMTPQDCSKLVWLINDGGTVYLSRLTGDVNEDDYTFFPVTGEHFFWDSYQELIDELRSLGPRSRRVDLGPGD